MLPASTQLLLLLLGHGCRSYVILSLGFGAATPLPQVVKTLPQVVKIAGEEMEEMWVPVISQIVKKMLLQGSRPKPINPQRMERILKRGVLDTWGSLAPSSTLAQSGWAPPSTLASSVEQM